MKEVIEIDFESACKGGDFVRRIILYLCRRLNLIRECRVLRAMGLGQVICQIRIIQQANLESALIVVVEEAF